jgi:hypothetical protein
MLLCQRPPLKGYLWCTIHPIIAYARWHQPKVSPPPQKKKIYRLDPIDLKICRVPYLTVTQQLTKSINFRQNYVCDTHLKRMVKNLNLLI